MYFTVAPPVAGTPAVPLTGDVGAAAPLRTSAPDPGQVRWPGPASSRSRRTGSAAASIAVQAMATAPSNTAWSAAGVTHLAVNSGWWLTAGRASMPMVGWIEGMAREMLPM